MKTFVKKINKKVLKSEDIIVILYGPVVLIFFDRIVLARSMLLCQTIMHFERLANLLFILNSKSTHHFFQLDINMQSSL